LCSSIGHALVDPFETEAAHEKVHAGLFPGAACCHPIELQHYKAAPLQALGIGGHGVHYEDEDA